LRIIGASCCSIDGEDSGKKGGIENGNASGT
jgi:hypothetical protein